MNGMTFCIVEPNAEIQGLLNILFDFGTKEFASQFMNVFITFLLFFIAISSETMYAIPEEIKYIAISHEAKNALLASFNFKVCAKAIRRSPSSEP